MGDGVRLYGIHDALVVTINPPVIRLEADRHDDEGQGRWKVENGEIGTNLQGNAIILEPQEHSLRKREDNEPKK